jgi:hypothetical protein
MDTRPTTRLALALALTAGLPLLGGHVSAQKGKGPDKTNSRILYHNGRVMTSTTNLYLIWYGCWTCGLPGSSPDTRAMLTQFTWSLGGSPYAMINTTYPDQEGQSPSGGFIYGGAVEDRYSRGPTLSESDVEGIVLGVLDAAALPVDSRAIYVVLASSDIHVAGLTDGRCQYHGAVERNGFPLTYAIVSNPQRAPSLCALQFVDADGGLLPTPNDDLAFDAMASWMAHAINGTVTNPWGNGWFDRFGLENSDKCQGTYGQTYTTQNGARANMNLNGRDLLIQQNWVNVGKGYCGLEP